MAAEQESTETRQKKKSGIAIVFGCAFTAIAMMYHGTLQWVLFAIAIGMLGYGLFLARKEKQSKPS
jgi:hypothetical protein